MATGISHSRFLPYSERRMSLNLTAFTNAIARLQEGLALHAAAPTETIIRDGLIQRFEFTYELSHKMLKRALESASPSPDQYDQMPFADLIRSGNEQGLLLGDWPAWKNYRDMRAKTSHTYNEAIALEVVQGIAKFLHEAAFLRDQLRQRAP
jgi:nucleotidyltransferase substrate binding protein (TIGR01987 family)